MHGVPYLAKSLCFARLERCHGHMDKCGKCEKIFQKVLRPAVRRTQRSIRRKELSYGIFFFFFEACERGFACRVNRLLIVYNGVFTRQANPRAPESCYGILPVNEKSA